MLSFYETFQRHNVPDTLKDEVYSSDENRIDIIENFSKVNIFIGPNNSGKSKFIRELIKQKPIPYYGTKNWATIIDIIENIFLTVNKKLSEVFTKSNHFIVSNSTSGMLIDTEELANYKITLFEYIPNYDISNIVTQLEHRFVLIQSAMVQNSSYFLLEKGSSSFGIESSIAQKFIEKFKEIKEYTIPQLEKLKGFRFLLIGEKEMSRIYIPSVRTLRFLGSNVNLKDKTKGEYGFEDVVEIYNGQDFPEEVFKLTNSPFIEKQKLTQFEKLLSKDFFDSKDVKLTFHKEKEVLLIKIGEEIERPIHELGDGLQMLIILTFPFFTNDSGIIAIEEPELFLHPGLQKIFVNFLISNPVTEKFQIF